MCYSIRWGFFTFKQIRQNSNKIQAIYALQHADFIVIDSAKTSNYSDVLNFKGAGLENSDLRKSDLTSFIELSFI
jgi:hypothetical protein